MAINIENDAVKAITELRGVRHFEEMLDALEAVAQKRMYASMSSPVELRVEQTAHARGIFELIVAMRAAYENMIPSQVKQKPMPKLRDPMNAA